MGALVPGNITTLGTHLGKVMRVPFRVGKNEEAGNLKVVSIVTRREQWPKTRVVRGGPS